MKIKKKHTFSKITEKEIIANFEILVREKMSCRQLAKEWGIGKSTVHSIITRRIKEIDPDLYKKVKKRMLINKRHRSSGWTA